ncbi:hypothetical protein D3C87_1359980 [compost metagenome]
MRSLFPVLANHVVSEKRFSGTGRTKDEFISVCDDTFFHREIRYIQMNWFSRKPICHFYPEMRGGIVVIRFLRKKTERWFNKRVEAFLTWKVGCIAGH